MQFNLFKQKIQTLPIQGIIWIPRKRSTQCIGMKKVNPGRQNLSKWKNITDLQNASTAEDLCHIT